MKISILQAFLLSSISLAFVSDLSFAGLCISKTPPKTPSTITFRPSAQPESVPKVKPIQVQPQLVEPISPSINQTPAKTPTDPDSSSSEEATFTQDSQHWDQNPVEAEWIQAEIGPHERLQFVLDNLPLETLKTLNLDPNAVIEIGLSFPEGFEKGRLPHESIQGAHGLEEFLRTSIRQFTRNYQGEAQAAVYFEQLRDYLQNQIYSCRNFCPLCNEKHEYSPFKIIPCHRAFCQWRFAELGIGSNSLHELKGAPQTVDLLISTAYLAITSQLRDQVFNPFPERFLNNNVRDYKRIQNILAHLPPIETLLELSDEPNNLKALLNMTDPDSYYLLRWLLFSNRSYIQPIPCEQIKNQVKNLQCDRVVAAFQFASLPPEREKEFLVKKAQAGTTYVYHGSPSGNWHSILRNFLGVFSGTSLQRHGAVYGRGIYFAKQQLTSEGYMKTEGTPWPVSKLGLAPRMMLIAEIVQGQAQEHSWGFVVTDPQTVATRYLLVY